MSTNIPFLFVRRVPRSRRIECQFLEHSLQSFPVFRTKWIKIEIHYSLLYIGSPMRPFICVSLWVAAYQLCITIQQLHNIRREHIVDGLIQFPPITVLACIPSFKTAKRPFTLVDQMSIIILLFTIFSVSGIITKQQQFGLKV